MNYKDYLKKKLKRYEKKDIIITNHACQQAVFREIDLEEVKENIINPERLSFARKQEAEKGKEKYDCYFGYSKTQCQKYVLVVNSNCIVCTLIKINRRWQYVFEKNTKI